MVTELAAMELVLISFTFKVDPVSVVMEMVFPRIELPRRDEMLPSPVTHNDDVVIRWVTFKLLMFTELPDKEE